VHDEGFAVTETIVSMEHLLAAWRDAERALALLEPTDPRRADAEARVVEGRAAYQARVESIEDHVSRGNLVPAR
jgi:hypothetical protein